LKLLDASQTWGSWKGTFVMQKNEVLRRLGIDGWCVVNDVIPKDKVKSICSSVVKTAGNGNKNKGVMGE
jgi:hypothetical protein